MAATISPPPPPVSPRAPLPRGTTVDRYVILALAGRGGMGDVYAAYDPQLDRKVALKLLHDLGSAGETRARSQSRLLKEAKAIARLSHPNVVTVHDAGTIDDRVFIAMEFVEGTTLAAWLGGKPRPWSEIRAMFLAAGRGLAAAHAARIIHRDFKPQNVMVAPDGTVRVMDFGLAASEAPDSDGVGDPPVRFTHAVADTMAVAMTGTGTLVGTPAYMAPEQFQARPTGAATDQFSFCVSLWEALHGERPFAGETIAALAASVTEGAVREPSQRARVPGWLRKVLQRGLRFKQEDRFASMDDLLAALERDPERKRRRVLVGAGVAALLLVGGAFAHRTLGRSGAALCQGAGGKLAAAWELLTTVEGASRPRRDAMRTAFLASGARRASETWERVATVLDGYAQRWMSMYRDACEATHVRGEQSPEVLDLRMDCLTQSQDSLHALGDVFMTADEGVVRQAIDAADALPDLGRCADVRTLRATRTAIPPPRDPLLRRQVEELRRRATDVRALRDSGRWKEGLARVEPLVAQARQLGHQPLVAEMLALRGWLLYWLAEPKAAKDQYEQALWAAEGVRHDEVAAEAAIQLTGITAWDLSQPDDSRRWAQLAGAIVQRMGPGHQRFEAWLAHNHGMASQRAGDLEEAEQQLRRAARLRQSALGNEHPDVATSINSLAEVLGQVGKLSEAIEMSDDARASYDRAYGAGSAIAATVLSNRGEYLIGMKRYDEALVAFRQAIVSEEAALDPWHQWLAYPLTGSGVALLALHRAREAIQPLERAVAVRDRSEPRTDLRADARFALGRAIWDSGADRARARAAVQAARIDYTKAPQAERQIRDVDAWLAAHPVAPLRAR